MLEAVDQVQSDHTVGVIGGTGGVLGVVAILDTGGYILPDLAVHTDGHGL